MINIFSKLFGNSKYSYYLCSQIMNTKNKISSTILYVSLLVFVLFVVYILYINQEVFYTAHDRSEFIFGTPFFNTLLSKPFGLKTLVVDISNANGTTILVNNGWWSTTYYDDVALVDGPNEIQITEQIANECAKGGDGKDLQFIFKSGGECTINSVYYEE